MYIGFCVTTVSPCDGSWDPLTSLTAAPGVPVVATYMTPLDGAAPELRISATLTSTTLMAFTSRASWKLLVVMTPPGRETRLLFISVATPSTIRRPDLEYIFAARRSAASVGL